MAYLFTQFLLNPAPFLGGQTLFDAYRVQRTEDHHQVPLPPELHPEHCEPVLLVEEGDTLHESGDLFRLVHKVKVVDQMDSTFSKTENEWVTCADFGALLDQHPFATKRTVSDGQTQLFTIGGGFRG